MDLVSEFFKLKEYDSLGRERLKLQKQKDEELDRLRRRSQELADQESLLTQQKSDARQLDKEIHELDRRLSQRLSDEAKEKLEQQGLNLLIKQQELEQQIEETKTFLSGFRSSLDEITQDVNTSLKELDLKLQQLANRQQEIFANLPVDWQIAYKKIAAKNPAFGCFTKLSGLNCEFCRFAVSKQFQSELDQLLGLKSCPGCQRIMLPYQVVSGTR